MVYKPKKAAAEWLIEKIRHSHDIVLAVLFDLFLLVYCMRPGVTNALSFAYSVLLLAYLL